MKPSQAAEDDLPPPAEIQAQVDQVEAIEAEITAVLRRALDAGVDPAVIHVALAQCLARTIASFDAKTARETLGHVLRYHALLKEDIEADRAAGKVRH